MGFDWKAWCFGASIGFIVIFLGMMYINSQRVDIHGKISCNTGYVGINAEWENIILNKTCSKVIGDQEQKNCFEEDLLLQFVKLKDISGLKCDIEYNVNVPVGFLEKHI